MSDVVAINKDYLDVLTYWPRPYAAPIFFGDRPHMSDNKKINNATISLIEFNGKKFGITCEHVFSDGFDISNSSNHILQICNTEIPIDRLCYRDKTIDMAIIDLSGMRLDNLYRDEIGNRFFSINKWPDIAPLEGDIVTLAGFPGVWRNRESETDIMFDSFAIGATVIEDANEHRVIINADFQNGHATNIRHDRNPKNLEFLGGMSGAPVFKIENGNIIQTYSFLGILVGGMHKAIEIRPLASQKILDIITKCLY